MASACASVNSGSVSDRTTASVSSIWFLLILAYSPAASRVLSAAPHDVAEWTVEPSPPGVEDPTDRANQPAAAALPPPLPLSSEKLRRPAVEGAVLLAQRPILAAAELDSASRLARLGRPAAGAMSALGHLSLLDAGA